MARKKPPVRPPLPPIEEAFLVGSWAGLTLYQCRECAFDTLDVEAAAAHLAEAHLHDIPQEEG